MTIREFNNLGEIQKYYDEKSNTYIFKENDDLIDLVIFNFNLNVKANINVGNIDAWNINAEDINAINIDAWNISARDIDAGNITAMNINAQDISYYAVCFAYQNIKCKSIKGIRKNAKHFVLNGELEVEENEKQGSIK